MPLLWGVGAWFGFAFPYILRPQDAPDSLCLFPAPTEDQPFLQGAQGHISQRNSVSITRQSRVDKTSREQSLMKRQMKAGWPTCWAPSLGLLLAAPSPSHPQANDQYESSSCLHFYLKIFYHSSDSCTYTELFLNFVPQ